MKYTHATDAFRPPWGSQEREAPGHEELLIASGQALLL